MGEAAALVLVTVLIVLAAASVAIFATGVQASRRSRPLPASERHRRRYIETGDLSALGDIEKSMEEEE